VAHDDQPGASIARARPPSVLGAAVVLLLVLASMGEHG
jgi:hypothetical protein